MLSVIIGILILAQMVGHTNENVASGMIESAANQLETQCNAVCRSERGTRLSTRVTLPADAIVSAQERTLCVQHHTTRSCALCDCDIVSAQDLVLNLTGARRFFSGHTYQCTFDRQEDIHVQCMG